MSSLTPYTVDTLEDHRLYSVSYLHSVIYTLDQFSTPSEAGGLNDMTP